MHSVDEVVPLLGVPLDETAVGAIFGVRGEELLTDCDPGHPEDRRRYYLVRRFGLQMLIDDAGTVETIFFMIEGDDNVDAYPWSFGRLNGSSKRADVVAALGKPDRSSQAGSDDPFARDGWDRFTTHFGFVHVQYRTLDKGISMVTLMRPAVKSPGR